jgi:hypothetical protein
VHTYLDTPSSLICANSKNSLVKLPFLILYIYTVMYKLLYISSEQI